MAYFIRRAGDGCAVIALHPDDHEEVSASGMAIAAANWHLPRRVQLSAG